MSDTTRLAKPSGVAKSDDVNRLRAIVQMNLARASAGQIGVRGSHGSVFRQSEGFRTKAYAAIAASEVKPFSLYNASVGATLKVGVRSGTVNLVVPTLGGVALDDSTPPTLTITATRYLWLKCVGTFGTPDSYAATIEDSATSAVPSGTTITGTGFVSYLSIGYATVSGGVITSITPLNNYNWNVESYGSVNEWWH